METTVIDSLILKTEIVRVLAKFTCVIGLELNAPLKQRGLFYHIRIIGRALAQRACRSGPHKIKAAKREFKNGEI